MSRIFRSFCFLKVSAAAVATSGQFSRNLACTEPELKPESFLSGVKTKMAENRPGALYRFFHRRTKEEEILLFEKRYLKKLLRHHNLYLDHMTLPEMRLAKRCLEESILGSSSESTSCSEPSSPTSRAHPKTTDKRRVTFHRNLVQRTEYIPVALSLSSGDSEAEAEAEEDVSPRNASPPAEWEFDFGPFLLGGDNGPTYVSFEQPEP